MELMILVEVKTICEIWFRVAIMGGWRIMYGSGWDPVDSFWTTSLEHMATLMRWIGSITRSMDGIARPWWCDRWMKQPNPIVVRRKSVMFKSDLLPSKFSWVSPNFSPVIADQYLFIFVKLEEDNICLFYNLPFGQTHRYVLTSLAIVKLVLV